MWPAYGNISKLMWTTFVASKKKNTCTGNQRKLGKIEVYHVTDPKSSDEMLMITWLSSGQNSVHDIIIYASHALFIFIPPFEKIKNKAV